ncbi:MAG: NAD-dependent epimerase/dehydratase family protein [Parcubacteria group bacterium GW2011_GWA2_44_12]|nr:MAG: NAD-dependent epimerase/dehydratase family protein [Parcubacteria group bacterium GW2011_GWA2_44_12]
MWDNTYYSMLTNDAQRLHKRESEKKYAGIVVVGGGAGFLGSHLCDKLIENYQVIVIDDLSTANFSHIEYLLQKPNFEFIRHDLNDPLDLNETPEGKRFEVAFKGVDAVFHLAFPASPVDFLKIPVQTLMASARMTYNLLSLSRFYNARFILGSSGAVYGRPDDDGQVFSEAYEGRSSPTDSLSCNIEGRRFAESLTMNFRRQHNIDAKIMRIFGAYGPRMKLGDGKEISDFVKSAVQNKPVIIYGDEKSTISLCHIDDIVSALLAFMISDEIGPINVGDPQLYVLAEIAEAVIKLAESSSRIEYRPPPKFTMREGVPDIRKARELLNWLPLMPIEKGLVETVSALRASRVVAIDYERIAGIKIPEVRVPKGKKKL